MIPLCFIPLHDASTPHAPYAVRAVDDRDGVEHFLVGWYETLGEALDDAQLALSPDELLVGVVEMREIV